MAKSIYEGVDVVRQSGIHIKNDTPETRKTDLGKLSGRVKVVKYDGTGGVCISTPPMSPNSEFCIDDCSDWYT